MTIGINNSFKPMSMVVINARIAGLELLYYNNYTTSTEYTIYLKHLISTYNSIIIIYRNDVPISSSGNNIYLVI